MANNLIQIKRSTSTATPTSLSAGELAYSNTSKVLFIGSTDGATVVPLAGVRNPGTLTANQALVANATSGIDQVQVGNVVMVGATQTISANGDTGSAGYILLSGGTTANMYWAAPSTLSVNSAATYNWTNVHTWFANLQVNSSSLAWIGNTTTSPTVTLANTGAFTIGNSTTTETTAVISVANSAGNVQITPGTTSILATGLINASSFTTTGSVNTGTVYATGLVNAANFTTTGTVNTATVYATGLVNAANFTTTGTVNTGTVYATGLVNAANFTTTGTVNTATVYATGLVNAANFTTTGTVNTGTVYATSTINAVSYNTGGGYGTATGGAIVNTTTIAVGNSSVNGSITSNTTVTYFTGTAYTANNATNLGGVAAASYVQNTDSRTLSGNLTFTGAVSTFSGTNVAISGTNMNVSSNATFSANVTLSGANVVISGTNTAISSNVTLTGASVTGTSTDVTFRNGTFSGNLVVSGTVVTVNTAQLTVNDNIIELAYNQTTADTVDTGLFSPAGNSSAIWYSGIVRQASKSSNSNPYFWIFGSNTNPNTSSTVDTSANSTTGTLQAYLVPYGTGGAFVANSLAVTITANSTVNVNITANSLTLSTALAATSGGTGQSSYATGDLLYASSTTALSKLSVPGSAANGQVLQISNNLPAYGTSDGGTF